MPKTKTVTVTDGWVVYTHPDHPDGLHAPDADQLAAHGVVTASATAHHGGDKVSVPPDDLGDAVQ